MDQKCRRISPCGFVSILSSALVLRTVTIEAQHDLTLVLGWWQNPCFAAFSAKARAKLHEANKCI